MEDKYKSYFWNALAVVFVTAFYWNPIFLNHPESLQIHYPKEDEFSKEIFYLLKDGSLSKVVPLLIPSLRDESSGFVPSFSAQMTQMGEIQAIHMTLEDNAVDKSTNLKYENFEYLIDFKNGSANYGLALIPQGETFEIAGIHYWHRCPYPYDEIFPFQLEGRSWLQFLFLFLGYGLFLACGFTFVSCAQSNIAGRWSKGFWLFLLILGSIDLNMYWLPSAWLPLSLGTHTATSSNIQFFTLFPAGISRIGIYNPWRIWISIPVGLILYYWKKPYLEKGSEKEPKIAVG